MLYSLVSLKRLFTVIIISIIFSHAYAADFSISSINDIQVEEFTYYQSPVPEANNPSGNVEWSLYTENLQDYRLLKTLPRFTGMSNLQIIIWLAFNYQKIDDFVIDPSTGIVSLPPQAHSSSSSNTYYPILIATDSSGNKAALQWTVEITKNSTASFSLHGIESSTIYEKVRYQPNTPYILGTPLLLPNSSIRYTLSGDRVGEYFSVDSNTGKVSLLKALNYDENNQNNNTYNLTLTAKDDAGKKANLDWALTIAKLPPGAEFKISNLPSVVTVSEYSAYRSPQPILIGVHNPPVTYALDNNAASHFNVGSDGIVELTTPLAFDSNGTNSYPITLTVTESLGEKTTFSWVVNIVQLPPRQFYIENQTENLQENFDYLGSILVITGSYYPPLSFTIDGQQACNNNPSLEVCLYSIDPKTGRISVPGKVYQADPDQQGLNSYTINITATDKVGNTSTRILVINILYNFDKDSDNDGVKDTYELAESTVPFNENSFRYTWDYYKPDALSIDADADGISNIDESGNLDPYNDNNSDGIPNYLDPYDRGDGNAALCVIKFISNYPDNSGSHIQKAVCDIQFGLDPVYDYDQDGVPNFRDTDSDSDGIPDVIEGGMFASGNFSGIVRDTDGDGAPDFLDLDSDNDGIPDVVENHYFSKTNSQGIADVFYGYSISYLFNGALAAQGFKEKNLEDAILFNSYMADYDQDGIPNYLDRDSDGDGIPDQLEGTVPSVNVYQSLHTRLSNIDNNNNGIPDIFESEFTQGEDSNNNAIDDRYDAAITTGPSTLISGIDDIYADAALHGYRINIALSTADKIALSPNTSGKGNPDYLNLDSDNDCIADSIEANSSHILNGFFIDSTFAACYTNDGKYKDHSCLIDTDGDGIPDFRDLDSDNDGLMDVDEASTNTLDKNRDGQCDFSINLITNKLQLLNTDGDNLPNYLDLQSDASVFDIKHVQPPLNNSDYDTNGRIIATGDTDIDGIDNLIDTAPMIFGMKAIDCDDPANTGSDACQNPVDDECELNPDAPGCNPPIDCSLLDNALLPECFVPPPECELDPNAPGCETENPAIDCSLPDNAQLPECFVPPPECELDPDAPGCEAENPAIDCSLPDNAQLPECFVLPPECETDPNAPGCEAENPAIDCSLSDSAQWPECFVPPPECEIGSSLPQCMPPPPIDCDINFSHPNCQDPAKNPKNGKIKTDEHGSINLVFISMLLIVWAARRRRFK